MEDTRHPMYCDNLVCLEYAKAGDIYCAACDAEACTEGDSSEDESMHPSSRPLKIKLASDVHLENVLAYSPTRTVKKEVARVIADVVSQPPAGDADVLVLAGDIGYPRQSHYSQIMLAAAAQFEDTVVVAGNHE